ncbi:MAG TPA: quinone-dependent dihydroorotate dehydrogenase [Myxococcales bacterium]|nr:quinone-dependent dihydroorotate dehydrogenase [Myxococcales bacterium]
MYRLLLRPLLFLLPAETAHHLGLLALRALSAFPPLCRWLRRRALRALGGGVDLSVQLGPLRLEHPLALAAGFDKDAAAVPGLFALGFSAVEVGTVTPRPQPGNPRPRMFRLPEHAALINRLGFNNRGAGAAAGKLAALRPAERPGPVGANLGKNKDTPLEGAAADYLLGAEALAPRADYLVVNASSPNTPGLRSLQEPEALAALLSQVKRAAAGRPVFLKIAPDLAMEAVDQIVDVAIAAGADGLIATNTTVDRPLRHPRAAEAGGLSGAPLSEPAAAILARAAARAGGRLALIGSGGVMTASDAYRRIRAGAQAVQLYTGFIYGGPWTVARMLRELVELLRRDGYPSVAEAVGADLRAAEEEKRRAASTPAAPFRS